MWNMPVLQRAHAQLPNWIIKIHYNPFPSTNIHMMIQSLPQHHLTFFASWSKPLLHHEHH